MKIFVFAGLLLTLAASLFIGFASEEQQAALVKRLPWLNIVGVLLLLFVLALVAMHMGMIARGETSALPWEAYRQEALRHDVSSGVFSFLSTVTYNLWTLWLPGHLFASSQKTNHGKRPIYPYVINVLVGLLLSTENDPLYRMFDSLPL